MAPNEQDPLNSSRSKTDKSLSVERTKTDTFIEQKVIHVDQESDERTRLNRNAADTKLAKTRAKVDLEKDPDQLVEKDLDLHNERDRADKAQLLARLAEDKLRERERFRKRMIAEALLEIERSETDSNLLEERERSDVAHDDSKNALITRDQFLAVVSHDLKNPLSAISMGASLMRMALTKGNNNHESQLKFLGIIERSAANMDRMISDLLDVERMSNHKLSLNFEKIEIGKLLQESAELFEPAAAARSCTISFGSIPRPIYADVDHDKILQVISNLLGNALKFSPKGSLVTLSLRNLGAEIEVSVSDNGPGIPENKKAEIFERFSQLKSNDRRGLGLGLFISKWIVEAHKGRIWFKSNSGQGSTFSFSIPAGVQGSESA